VAQGKEQVLKPAKSFVGFQIKGIVVPIQERRSCDQFLGSVKFFDLTSDLPVKNQSRNQLGMLGKISPRFQDRN